MRKLEGWNKSDMRHICETGGKPSVKLKFSGKTKDVYENPDGTYTLKLKDAATGKDGVFDPGENTVGLSIEGLGRESMRLSVYFFELLKTHGIKTHYVSHNPEEVSMTVIAAEIIGKGIGMGKGIEFVCRFVADGSFVKRYGAYTSFGDKLDALVEVTLKDDAKNDPPITKNTLCQLGILTEKEYDEAEESTKKIARIIQEHLKSKGLVLHDIKFEFGKTKDGIILSDEISAGCMRVYKDGKIVEPMALGGLVL